VWKSKYAKLKGFRVNVIYTYGMKEIEQEETTSTGTTGVARSSRRLTIPQSSHRYIISNESDTMSPSFSTACSTHC
jgi:hypothetical protein